MERSTLIYNALCLFVVQYSIHAEVKVPPVQNHWYQDILDRLETTTSRISNFHFVVDFVIRRGIGQLGL